MIWLLMGLQLLFDFGVFLFLLALFARVRELRHAGNREAPPAWQEELLSTLDRLLSALADRLPPAASSKASSHDRPSAPRSLGPRSSAPAGEPGSPDALPCPSPLLGESSLASRLEAKRRFSAGS